MTKIIASNSHSRINVLTPEQTALDQKQTEQKNNVLVPPSKPEDVFSPGVSSSSNKIKPAPLFKMENRPPISEMEQRYYKEAQEKGAPQISETPAIKSKTHTFNHTHEFPDQGRLFMVSYAWRQGL